MMDNCYKSDFFFSELSFFFVLPLPVFSVCFLSSVVVFCVFAPDD